MLEVQIDAALFHKRIALIQKGLGSDAFGAAGCVLAVAGATNADNPYQKSTVLQQWLLGYEFPSTALLVLPTQVVIVTSEKKARHLSPLVSSSVLVWLRTNDAAHNTKLFKDLAALLPSTIGHVAKDKHTGKFVDQWTEVFTAADHTMVDVAGGLLATWEAKDDVEVGYTKTAAKASDAMLDALEKEMQDTIDRDRKTLNEQLSEKIEKKLDDGRYATRLASQIGGGAEGDGLDWCYLPIVQSAGNNYDLRALASSSSDALQHGVILATLGLRYHLYCANVGRTFLIDPSKEVEASYDFLLTLQEHVLKQCVPGAVAKDVYAAAVAYVAENKPEFSAHFVKNCGFAIGLEFRDATLVLNSKCERTLHDGTTLLLTLGFSKLTDSAKKREYALVLTDTVLVGATPTLLTTKDKSRDKIAFTFEDDETAAPVKTAAEQQRLREELSHNERKSAVLKSKLRGELKSTTEDLENIRRELQKQLHEKRLKEGLARFDPSDARDDNDTVAVFKRYELYVRETQIPALVADLRLHVDLKAQTIILPISGRPVPFHINLYKNGSKNEEGEFLYLRLNFHSPGAGNTTKRTEIPYEDLPDLHFVRLFTFRSRDTERLAEVFKQITDMKKERDKREAERRAMADVVTQGRLVEIKGARIRKLESVYLRPAMEGKRVAGTLEIQLNGLRYQLPLRADSRVEVLFSNIKHLFFQLCKDELMVIIHIHLKLPLIVNKKKTLDLSFYREASEMSFDETGGRKRRNRYGDEDELVAEQEERKRRALLDKEFRTFAELIADASNGLVDLDMPFRELGFHGVPHRSQVWCMPTRDCLVLLVEPPYLVVTLDEVEICHLERVQFGLKNFDLVFVFKDFAKPVVHVNTIPVELLDEIKQWLLEMDIPLSEGPVNLAWGPIMKTVQQDPYQFFVDGGWSVLAGGSDEEGSEEESEESEFEVSDEDPSDEEVASEEDSGSGTEYSGSGSDSGEEEESGEDWDELDRKAARADARREDF